MLGMNKKETLERVVLKTNKKSAMKLRRTFMKVLMKDKKSSGMELRYTYHPLGRRADYTIQGHPKTVTKCLRAFSRFVKKQEKAAARRDGLKKLKPMATGKYYTMKPLGKRKRTR